MIDPYQDPFEEDEEAEEQRLADEAQEKAGFPVSFFGHLTEEEMTIKREEHDEFGEKLGELWPEKERAGHSWEEGGICGVKTSDKICREPRGHEGNCNPEDI